MPVFEACLSDDHFEEDDAAPPRLAEYLPLRIGHSIFGMTLIGDNDGRTFCEAGVNFAGNSPHNGLRNYPEWEAIAPEIVEAINNYIPMRDAAEEALRALKNVRLEGFGPAERTKMVKAKIRIERTLRDAAA